MALSKIVLLFAFVTSTLGLATCPSNGFPPFDALGNDCTAGSVGRQTTLCPTAPNACAVLSDGTFGCCAPASPPPPPGECLDGMTATSCAAWKNNGYCTSGVYSEAMKKAYCAKTCGLCGTPCTDASAACPVWQRNSNYCNSPQYTLATIKSTCAKTCGFC